MNSLRVALGIPFAGVGIRPARDGLRIPVVEDALHHARIHEQPFDLVPAPLAPRVGRRAVDVKGVADDRDGGFVSS